MFKKGQIYKLQDGLIICIRTVNKEKEFVTGIVVKGNWEYKVGGYDISIDFETLKEASKVTKLITGGK